ADALEIGARVLLIHTGGPAAGGVSEHALLHRAGRDIRRGEPPPVLTEGILRSLIGGGRETVEGDIEVDPHSHLCLLRRSRSWWPCRPARACPSRRRACLRIRRASD